ncbi:MAG: sugar phosphate isomerase/epimerase [Clostridia bacterium]|nr:sugar phosphate isomerase/epimerase [Clostridia bacterium]
MANFKICAFADEYSPNIDEQIVGMKQNGVEYIEIRNVDGTNIADITEDKAREVKAKFDSAGIKVWSMGSPIGKIDIDGDLDAHLEKLGHVIKLAKIFDCDKIRMFSFFIPDGAEKSAFREKVMSGLEKMLDLADREGILLCHENEKGIYGDTVASCLEIKERFGDRIKLIFDPANFCQCNEETYPYGYSKLGEHLHYMHIKDVRLSDQTIVPAGKGNGHIPEILSEINKRVEGDFILTLEPHLSVFDGLAGLEKPGDTTKIGNAYASKAEAFKAAADALKAVLANI